MMRHIREIEKLPISELTDEEIAKAALYRLNAQAVMLIYLDQEGQSYFLGRYKKAGGRSFIRHLLLAWEEKFGGKLKKITNNLDEE